MNHKIQRHFLILILIFFSPLTSATVMYYDFIEAGTGDKLGSIGFSSSVASHDNAWSSTDPSIIEFIRVDFGPSDGGVFELGVDFLEINSGFSVTSVDGSGLDEGFAYAFTPVDMRPGVDEFNLGFSSVMDKDSFSLESAFPIRYGNWIVGTGPVQAPEPASIALLGLGLAGLGWLRRKKYTDTN